jgi:hypothetical protein
MYRINVAEVPRQRPSTPEEEMIDRVVARMAWVPACLDRHKWQVRSYEEKGTTDLCASGASPCCTRVLIRSTSAEDEERRGTHEAEDVQGCKRREDVSPDMAPGKRR